MAEMIANKTISRATFDIFMLYPFSLPASVSGFCRSQLKRSLTLCGPWRGCCADGLTKQAKFNETVTNAADRTTFCLTGAVQRCCLHPAVGEHAGIAREDQIDPASMRLPEVIYGKALPVSCKLRPLSLCLCVQLRQ